MTQGTEHVSAVTQVRIVGDLTESVALRCVLEDSTL